METKEMKKDIKKSNKGWILGNIILAFFVVGGIVIGADLLLNYMTQHNKEIRVPDFTGMIEVKAAQVAKQGGVRIDVTDSVFIRRMTRGAVFSQNPKAGSHVKKGRRIMLTINAVNAKKVTAPDLVGYSLRQAMSELTAKGLRLGRLNYVRDIATNNVLGQTYMGRELVPGTQIESGKKIDLLIGLNPNDNITFVPDVLGMKYMRAVDAIKENSLNISSLKFDKTVKTYSDSLNSVVYGQTPIAVDSALYCLHSSSE